MVLRTAKGWHSYSVPPLAKSIRNHYHLLLRTSTIPLFCPRRLCPRPLRYSTSPVDRRLAKASGAALKPVPRGFRGRRDTRVSAVGERRLSISLDRKSLATWVPNALSGRLPSGLRSAPGEVGSAGLKDRRAVCRQMVSIPGQLEERLPQLEGDGIRVLSVSRHGNKLRPGHLHGNRFRILIRDPDQTRWLTLKG